jgi:hypothetical protein
VLKSLLPKLLTKSRSVLWPQMNIHNIGQEQTVHLIQWKVASLELVAACFHLMLFDLERGYRILSILYGMQALSENIKIEGNHN